MKKNDFMKTLIDFTIAVHDVIDEIRNEIKPDKITPLQYKILEMIFLNQISSVSEVCSCIGISLPNTSREIKKLTKIGLLKKIPHPSDGRRSMISLTEAGSVIMGEAFIKIEDFYGEKLSGMSVEEQEELKGYMELLMQKLFNSPEGVK